MDIQSIIKESFLSEVKIERCKYEPYSLEVAKKVWNEILSRIINKKPKYTVSNSRLYENAIKYAHGDETGDWDINKSLFITGNTGTGKTIFLQCLKSYMMIDQVKIIKSGQLCTFDFKIYNARDIISDYTSNGFDGIYKYCNYLNILIDDLGTESIDAKYFGTQLNCIEEVIEQRYLKQLFTHISTNLKMVGENSIQSRYGDRVFSRITQTTNYIELIGEDFRII